MPFKSVHVTNAYHPASGGVRIFYQELLKAANARRRHVRLVVPGEADGVEDIGPFGRIYHVAAPRAPVYDARYRLILPYKFLFAPRGRVWSILAEEDPDLIEICDKYAVCHLAGVIRARWPSESRPTLVGLSCERLDDNVSAFVTKNASAASVARWYLTHAYGPQFDYHLAVSPYVAAELESAGLPARICPMGADCRLFHPSRRSPAKRSAMLAKLGSEERGPILLYVGRISPEKNIPLLLDTMAALWRHKVPAHLVCVGEGPLKAWLEQQGRKRCPGRLHCWGQVGDREAIADLMANADFFLHPNPSEPFGIAPLEALASGLPLIAPASGGLLAYANEGNSWLVAPTGKRFAATMLQALFNPVERAHRIMRGRETAERHDWSLAMSGYFALCDSLHACRRGSARAIA